jgi:chorismate mutase
MKHSPYLASLCGAITVFGLLAFGQEPAVNQDSATLADFSRRVADYVKQRKDADAGVPAMKQSNSSHDIAHREHEVAEKIQSARSQAKQGDIFTPQVAQVFKRLIRDSLKAEEGTQIRKSLRHAEPVNRVAAEINHRYPRGVPLQSMPPSLLQNLPELPKDLDYRIVNHDLILRDVQANLVIDILPNAIAASQNVNASH